MFDGKKQFFVFFRSVEFILLVTSSSLILNKSSIETPNRSMTQTPVNEKRRNYRFYAGDP
jgi:hypothetical protein